jgi:hypothetical protein
MSGLLVTALAVGAVPASAIEDDIERCMKRIQEEIPDINILPSSMGVPLDECSPNPDPHNLVSFEPIGPASCVLFCDELEVEYFAVEQRHDWWIPPEEVKAYLVWCDVTLPTGHTVITAQVNTQGWCSHGETNCQLPCFAILETETPGIEETDLVEDVIEFGPVPICEQEHEVRVMGVRILEGSFVVPC